MATKNTNPAGSLSTEAPTGPQATTTRSKAFYPYCRDGYLTAGYGAEARLVLAGEAVTIALESNGRYLLMDTQGYFSWAWPCEVQMTTLQNESSGGGSSPSPAGEAK